MLGYVPDVGSTGNRLVELADLRAFLDHQGLRLPEDTDEVEWIPDPADRLLPTQMLQDAAKGFDDGRDPIEDEYGIGLGQIDRLVDFGSPPQQVHLLFGAFDPDAVARTVNADPFWSTQATTLEDHGESFYAWGEDYKLTTGGTSTMRPLGVGGRLWVSGPAAAQAWATEPLERTLAACAGAVPSFAADESYAGIAERLDEVDGWFNATITDHVPTVLDLTDPPGGVGGTKAAPVGALDGVEAYGFVSGPGEREGIAHIRVVVAAATAEQAVDDQAAFERTVAEGVSASGEPWADSLTLDASSVDGRFLIVDLAAEDAGVVHTDLLRGDSLIVSG